MSVQHHDLIHEFPELKERIHELKVSDAHFRRLFDEYHELTREIEKMEDEVTPVASNTEESAKVRRLHLKDELYGLLMAAWSRGNIMMYEALQEQLELRLAALRTRLASLKQDVSQAHSSDSAEQAQERENDEVVDVIANETELSIGVIQAALERIEGGTYGTCEACGKPISEARLGAIPEATRCVSCAL
jgi:RNA polymerase-binding transcription factor DksA/uncharacterized protein YdcH (DUF465 family)